MGGGAAVGRAVTALMRFLYPTVGFWITSTMRRHQHWLAIHRSKLSL